MAFRTDTKALVMAALSDGPKHGYAVAKAVREASSGELRLGEGQLYPALHTLEESGWVTGEWDPDAGEPPRRVYALTEAGAAELARRSARWFAFADAVARILPPEGAR